MLIKEYGMLTSHNFGNMQDLLKDKFLSDRIAKLEPIDSSDSTLNIIDDLPKIDAGLSLRELDDFTKRINQIKNQENQDLFYQSVQSIKSFTQESRTPFATGLLKGYGVQVDDNNFLKYPNALKGETPNVNLRSGLELLANNNLATSSEGKEVVKIFGDIGDISLNELANNASKFISPALEFMRDHPNLKDAVYLGGTVLTPLLIYRGVINAFNKTVPISSQITPNLSGEAALIDLRQIRRERLTFVLLAAPLLIFVLYNMNKPLLSKLSLEFNIKPDNSLTESTGSSDKGPVLSSLLILMNKINNHNNSRWKWLLFALFIFFTGIFLKLNLIDINTINNLNILNYFNVPTIYLKRLTILFSVISFIYIIRYILIIRIIYLYYNNKMTTSVFMPSFITNWIEEYKYIANLDEIYVKNRVDFYYKLMYVYIFIFLMLLLTLFIM